MLAGQAPLVREAGTLVPPVTRILGNNLLVVELLGVPPSLASLDPARASRGSHPQPGQLSVTRRVTIRADVIVAAIYEKAGTASARDMIHCTSPQNVPSATVHVLPAGGSACPLHMCSC